jgi:diamine N-acetyltransferase
MAIEIRDITKENLRSILRLDIKKEQAGFVASNAVSVAQSKFYPLWETYAFYNGNIPVGFVMFGPDEDDNTLWIIRMMIDKEYQGKGFGRQGLKLVLELIRSKYSVNEIYLSFEPHNDTARKLYESFGFEDTGRIEEGEIVYKLKL